MWCIGALILVTVFECFGGKFSTCVIFSISCTEKLQHRQVMLFTTISSLLRPKLLHSLL